MCGVGGGGGSCSGGRVVVGLGAVFGFGRDGHEAGGQVELLLQVHLSVGQRDEHTARLAARVALRHLRGRQIRWHVGVREERVAAGGHRVHRRVLRLPGGRRVQRLLRVQGVHGVRVHVVQSDRAARAGRRVRVAVQRGGRRVEVAAPERLHYRLRGDRRDADRAVARRHTGRRAGERRPAHERPSDHRRALRALLHNLRVRAARRSLRGSRALCAGRRRTVARRPRRLRAGRRHGLLIRRRRVARLLSRLLLPPRPVLVVGMLLQHSNKTLDNH